MIKKTNNNPIPIPNKTNEWELKAVLNCLLLYNGKTICAIKEKSYTSHEHLQKYRELITTLPSKLDNELVEKVLEFAKDGVTKKDIMEKFTLSRPIVRRLTAELVGKDLLRQHVPLNLLVTTARGNVYLKRVRSRKQHSKL